MPEILQLLASGVHRYEGRPSDRPAPAPPDELVDTITVRAGLGVVGDRYFARPAHRDASITLIAAESLPAGADLVQLRRNVLLSGVAVDDLVGRRISLDSGQGPVLLLVNRAAHPCGWLDVMIAPGTRKALRGHGGVRCTPVNDGVLQIGPVTVEIG